MLGISSNPRQRLQQRARKQVRQGTRDARRSLGRVVGRGRHRAEALRDSLPAADDVMQDLREQAQPVMGRAQKAAQETIETMERATGRRKRSRSKKPFVLVGLLVLAGVVAYIFFSRRDQEPAYLVSEPDAPDTEPATGPSSGPSTEAPQEQSPRNGSMPEWRTPASTPSPAGAPSADLTAAGTTGSLGHHPATPALPDAGIHAPTPPAQTTPAQAPSAEPARPAEATPAPASTSTPAQPSTDRSEDREPSHAGGTSSPSASTASGPASLYEAWSAPGPASRAAWDLPRSAMPPTRQPGL